MYYLSLTDFKISLGTDGFSHLKVSDPVSVGYSIFGMKHVINVPFVYSISKSQCKAISDGKLHYSLGFG